MIKKHEQKMNLKMMPVIRQKHLKNLLKKRKTQTLNHGVWNRIMRAETDITENGYDVIELIAFGTGNGADCSPSTFH